MRKTTKGSVVLLLITALGIAVPLTACGRGESPSADRAPQGQKAPAAAEKPAQQHTFASPDEAADALATAARSGDTAALVAIFGGDAQKVLLTGDAATDKQNFATFVTAYDRMHRWGPITAGGQTLYVGESNFAFPVPLDRNAEGRWVFDTAAGSDELLARRIGSNELDAIAALEAIAQAHAAGKGDEGAKPDTVNGYVLRTLTKPGTVKNAFAVIAYPTEYRVSGLVTFMIGTDGITYQKDLGEKTTEIATQMSDYNPADHWTPVITGEHPAKTPAAPGRR